MGWLLHTAAGQTTIVLDNPSFDAKPRIGIDAGTAPIPGWTDCGLAEFPGTSPPDIHPLPREPWYQNVDPIDGGTYLGLVTRRRDTWEFVSQHLAAPMVPAICYRLTGYLVQMPLPREGLDPVDQPAILRIWGGHAECDRGELLGESPAILSTGWQFHTFLLCPEAAFTHITLEAYYAPGYSEAYGGHLLIDALSDLEPTTKPTGTAVISSIVTDPPARVVIGRKAASRNGASAGGTAIYSSAGPDFQPQILRVLIPGKLREGQTIRIDQLHYGPDAIDVPANASAALDELARYLSLFPNTVIEIGGHTNTIPPEDYCLELSTARALAVRQYLLARGVSVDQVLAKGYGKSSPIISYDKYNRAGRTKNQRVEIRFLTIE
jgi:outer membrane protein OmpA-like peptidoglycan-associated protein